MIVAAIAGLLAAVAIPKYGDLLEKANLGATLGNLASLRSSTSIYYGNYMGYPLTIVPGFQPKLDGALTGETLYVKSHFPAAHPPFGNGVIISAVTGVSPCAAGTGWFYNNTDGTVFINSTETDIKGKTAYSAY
jgi:Tfp pilus assembly protein PilE